MSGSQHQSNSSRDSLSLGLFQSAARLSVEVDKAFMSLHALITNNFSLCILFVLT